MKSRQRTKRAAKGQPRKISLNEQWRNSQADALAMYQADQQRNPGCPALSQSEINELYGRPDLNPALRQTKTTS